MTASPLAIRDAATVVILRPAPESFEVLLLQRHQKSDFMGGAYVFPGGKVDHADRLQAQALLAGAEPGTGPRDAFLLDSTPGRPLSLVDALALRLAALREAQEEVDVRLWRHETPGWDDLAALRYWAHWLTPSFEPRRFDARFFMTLCPPGQVARADAHEATEVLWITPATALARAEAQTLVLPPPTLKTFEELARFATAEAAFEATPARAIVTILPKIVGRGDKVVVLMPWDSDYAASEGESLPGPGPEDAEGRGASRVELANGGWRLGQGGT